MSAKAERKPLEDLFVGTGEYFISHRKFSYDTPRYYGPFLNVDVAIFWACDAFGRDERGRSWSLIPLERPWVVPPEERKFNP